MRKLGDLDVFSVGDRVTGRYMDNETYFDAKVFKEEQNRLYVMYDGHAMYLEDFYNLTKHQEKDSDCQNK